MHIGSPLIYIGGSWPIGGWQSASIGGAQSFPNQGSESNWIFYNTSSGNVITDLSFGTILPEASAFENITAEYRGYNPIVVRGFYVVGLPREFYQGTASSLLDKEAVIEWADFYTKGATPPGTPGLEVQFVDFDTQLLQVSQFKTGEGDDEATPVPYTGHENSIITRGDRIEMTLRVTAPSNSGKELLSAMDVHFGVDISFIEVPSNLLGIAEEGDC